MQLVEHGDRETLAAYEAFVAGHEKAAFTQSLDWTKVKYNWDWEVVLSRDGTGAIRGGMLILLRKVPFFPHRPRLCPARPGLRPLRRDGDGRSDRGGEGGLPKAPRLSLPHGPDGRGRGPAVCRAGGEAGLLLYPRHEGFHHPADPSELCPRSRRQKPRRISSPAATANGATTSASPPARGSPAAGTAAEIRRRSTIFMRS